MNINVVSARTTKVSYSETQTLITGLVGWWTFDGNKLINNVTDSSGSGNNGSMTNFAATSTVVTPGKLGQALKFDGTNDIVTTPQLSTGTGPFSISAWVKVDDLAGKSFNNGVAIIAHFNNDLAGDFALSITSGYSVSFLNNRTGGNDPAGESETSANVVSKNKWAHVVAVWDGSVNKIYVDGINKTFTSSSWGDWGTESGLGRLANLGLYHYKGLMDDVRVYNRVLSSLEVRQLYNLGNAIITSSNINLSSPLNSGLVGYWTFDGANLPWTSVSAATALDSSGNGNTATLTGLNRLNSPVEGKSGQALYFPRITATNGVNTSGTIGSVTSGYSFSFWFKEPNINLDTYYLFAWADLACRFGGRSTNTINCYADAGSGGSAFYSTTVNDNKWHHAVFTATDGGAGSNNQTLYIDGISRSTATETTNGYASRMWIASDVNGLSGNLKGTLDDFRFYNRVLSASEVRQLYNSSSVILKP